jgi:hypothetical protein
LSGAFAFAFLSVIPGGNLLLLWKGTALAVPKSHRISVGFSRRGKSFLQLPISHLGRSVTAPPLRVAERSAVGDSLTRQFADPLLFGVWQKLAIFAKLRLRVFLAFGVKSAICY